MSTFKPAFEATQVSSMQWNRTAPMAVAEAGNLTKPTPISPEMLKELKHAVQLEASKM
ncbi:hypothetical protein [Alkalihalophilus marmarensis]|uniref:Uncharacterized protein n=1 Tax=Alkalihalophilus marmarensis DSM 21297 TaxID=1188261 RepID=U6SK24_9BACI|nr:hypothetical protein [Alkalihalophilus marmarensis]ERN52074.1 hypothetical protein A33I_18450 [Alkalihalophilus marmarensis DSM 21297]